MHMANGTTAYCADGFESELSASRESKAIALSAGTISSKCAATVSPCNREIRFHQPHVVIALHTGHNSRQSSSLRPLEASPESRRSDFRGYAIERRSSSQLDVETADGPIQLK